MSMCEERGYTKAKRQQDPDQSVNKGGLMVMVDVSLVVPSNLAGVSQSSGDGLERPKGFVHLVTAVITRYRWRHHPRVGMPVLNVKRGKAPRVRFSDAGAANRVVGERSCYRREAFSLRPSSVRGRQRRVVGVAAYHARV